MDLTRIPLFAMMTRRMSWLNERQKILAQNIANADTPKYKPLDLKPLDFTKLVREAERKVKLASTQANHIRPKSSDRDFRDVKQKKPYGVAPAGNAVVLEEQMMKVADTKIAYELTTALYKKHVGFLRMAMGRNGR